MRDSMGLYRVGRKSFPTEKKRKTFQVGLTPMVVDIVNKLFPDDHYSFSTKVLMTIERAGELSHEKGCIICKEESKKKWRGTVSIAFRTC